MKKLLITGVVLLIIYVGLHPWVNSNPVRHIKIHGRFPFDKGYKLSFSTSAHTTNGLARFVCGGFGFFNGAVGIDCQGGQRIIEPKIVGCCSYELDYFNDYYLSGILSWTTSPVYYRVHYGDFNNIWGGVGLPNRAATIRCSKEAIESGAKYLVCSAEKPDLHYIDGIDQLSEKQIDFDISESINFNRR